MKIKTKVTIIITLLLIIVTTLFINYKYFSFAEPFSSQKSQNNIVCIYAYYEKNDLYKEHLRLFLNNAIRPNIDYYIVINGSCSLDIPEKDNLKVIVRPNTGFDFGAWTHCINHILTKKYDYYTFVNSSVKYVNDKNYDWFSKFVSLFHDRENIQLVGTSINILMDIWVTDKSIMDKYAEFTPPYTHVQSMFFILNQDGMDVLKDAGFWSNENEMNTKNDFTWTVLNKEITMSQIILSNGGGINSILSKYRGLDYISLKENINFSGDDPYWDGAYFGKSIDPEEAIFYKNNRQM